MPTCFINFAFDPNESMVFFEIPDFESTSKPIVRLCNLLYL